MIDTIITWAASQGLSLATLVLKAVIIAVLGLLVIRIVNKILTGLLERSKLEKAAHTLLLTLAKTVMYILLGLILASSIGIDVTGIVALASVVSLAVSLALQDMLGNLVGGFTILYTHPFSSGDYVEVAGQAGSVKEIGMTYTKLQTPDNKMVSIPNSAVVSSQIVNYSVTGTRRVSIEIFASYDTPVQQVLDTLVACADEPQILSEPEAPYAVLTGYGQSVINYQLRYWVNSADYWTTTFAINQKIKDRFDQAGVKISYPHLNVHLDK